ncbi:FecR family protein [Hyphomicrobium album]|uniref:FecR family protein n=1 Tax=Hyphomicrobium album TaxID=2665159 RepID=UPI0018AC83FA|nr:FecR domain-containing protein [Hyphomicrobium album]
MADIPENPFLTVVDREAHDWMMRFTAGNASPEDLAAFKQWSASNPARTQAFARACQLWEAIEPANQIRVQEHRKDAQKRSVRVGRRAVVGGALAASVGAAIYLAARPPLGLWPSWSELAADYRTAPGEQRSITLAGGPHVELNTRTSIALRPSANGTERIELIAGEASIVTRSEMRRAVEVIAADGQALTADAVFNIRYEKNIVCTTCVAGRLDIIHKGHVVRVRAGEQVAYSPDGLGSVTKVNASLVTAWKGGMLVFQSTPLAEAVAEINRYRSTPIIVINAALGRRLFNARFQIASIDGVVEQIQSVFGASVTRLPGGIVLLG